MKTGFALLLILTALFSGYANAKSPDEWKKFMAKNPQYAASILYYQSQQLEQHWRHIADLVAIGIIADNGNSTQIRACKECDLPRDESQIEGHANCLMERIGCLVSQ